MIALPEDPDEDEHLALFAVELASGNRLVVSSASIGEGPMFNETSDLLLDGDRVLALSWGRIFAVDLATGDRTILVDSSTALEPYDPVAIARSGDRLYATSGGAIVAR